MKLFSPAKVNLFLRVLGRRLDGFHEIASLFQAIDLGDTLTFSLSKHDFFTCNSQHIPCDRSNLVLRAADLFRQKTGLTSGLRVHLDKQIPVGAGLAGGSSNAATTLWALNQLHDCPASTEQLAAWSADIGSDIPFFFSEGRAYVTGRGEHVEPLPLRRGSGWLLIPSLSLSTQQIYRNLDLAQCSSLAPAQLLENGTLINDLEAPAFHFAPQLQKAKTRLIESGYEVLMTGSGSTLVAFGSKKPRHPHFRTIPFQFLERAAATWSWRASRQDDSYQETIPPSALAQFPAHNI